MAKGMTIGRAAAAIASGGECLARLTVQWHWRAARGYWARLSCVGDCSDGGECDCNLLQFAKGIAVAFLSGDS